VTDAASAQNSAKDSSDQEGGPELSLVEKGPKGKKKAAVNE
jgi:hypothetical protein